LKFLDHFAKKNGRRRKLERQKQNKMSNLELYGWKIFVEIYGKNNSG